MSIRSTYRYTRGSRQRYYFSTGDYNHIFALLQASTTAFSFSLYTVACRSASKLSNNIQDHRHREAVITLQITLNPLLLGISGDAPTIAVHHHGATPMLTLRTIEHHEPPFQAPPLRTLRISPYSPFTHFFRRP